MKPKKARSSKRKLATAAPARAKRATPAKKKPAATRTKVRSVKAIAEPEISLPVEVAPQPAPAAKPRKITAPRKRKAPAKAAVPREPETRVIAPTTALHKLPVEPSRPRIPSENLPALAGGAPRPGLVAPVTEPAGEKPKPLPFKIPPLLLEGDEPSPVAPAPPRKKQPAAPAVPGRATAPARPALPISYGTGKLHLMPRDPRSLHAHWDISPEEQQQYNNLSVHHHLVVRLHRGERPGAAFSETHVHPESRRWFLHVAEGGATWVAELGYYSPQFEWRSITISNAAQTPSDRPAEQSPARFITVPAERPLRAATPGGEPAARDSGQPSGTPPGALAQSINTDPGQEQNGAPGQYIESGPWPASQEEALEQIVASSILLRQWISSAELQEIVPGVFQLKPRAGRPLPAPSSLQLAQPPPGVEQSGSGLPVQGPPPAEQQAFWFNINAELVIYGATAPNAKVTIGGRVIRLRPDGTFSFRFALPDGEYALAVAAQSAAGDQRRANLSFSRRTAMEGEVGAHPQDSALRAPGPENAG
jgi:uncharacterized protein